MAESEMRNMVGLENSSRTESSSKASDHVGLSNEAFELHQSQQDLVRKPSTVTSPIPNGGTQAWLQVVGAWMLFL